MISRRKTFVLMLVFALSGFVHLTANDLQVSIRLYNEEVFFPDSSIYVHVQVQNSSAESIQFRLADDRLFNLDFNVTGPDNRHLERTREFTIRRATNQVFFRTVVLEPGERFSFVERLSDYVIFSRPDVYTVRAHFHPNLSRGHDASGSGTPLLSNTITLAIRPGYTTAVRQEMRFEALAEEELRRVRLSPDEVVTTMIESLRQSNWDQFFLNLNLEKIFRQAPERDRRFRALGEAQQIQEILRFRTSLMDAPGSQDQELVMVPDHFEILETNYSPTEGRVTVMMYYDYDRFRERKRYTFLFERRNGFWEIIGYQVVNLPNEARNQ